VIETYSNNHITAIHEVLSKSAKIDT